MFIAIFVWLLGAATLVHGQTDPLGPPDALYYNGKVLTVDSASSTRQAFAVRGDHFLAVGSNAEIRALAGNGTRQVNLQGRTVVPGLIDNHNHLYRAASTMLRGYDMIGSRSLKELFERLRDSVRNAEPGQALLAGGGWDPRLFPEKRGPTRQELDEIAPRNPLVLIRTRSQAFLNSEGLGAAGINRNTQEIAGFQIPKDAQGEPTGLISDRVAVAAIVNDLFGPLDEVQKREIILKTQQVENANGLTSIRELSLTPEIMRIYSQLYQEGKLNLRVSMGINMAASDADKMEEILRPWGVGSGFGNDWLRLDCVAEFGVDSGVENALLREPHLGDRPNYYGDARITPEKLRQAMLTMHKYGWRPSIHVVGDRALDMLLDAYEAADQVSPIRPRRWIVEHARVMQPDQMERMAGMGVLISSQIQPYLSAPDTLKHWGKERAERAVPVREWLDHNILVSSGTDWPARPLSPFITIYFYVTRKTPDGTPIGLSEKISRQEALRLATYNNAYMTFEEKTKGSIEAGKLADFVVLSDDLLTVPDEQIPEIHAVATFVGGRKVFATSQGSGF